MDCCQYVHIYIVLKHERLGCIEQSVVLIIHTGIHSLFLVRIHICIFGFLLKTRFIFTAALDDSENLPKVLHENRYEDSNVLKPYLGFLLGKG